MANIDRFTKANLRSWLTSQKDNKVLGTTANPFKAFLETINVKEKTYDDVVRKHRAPLWSDTFAAMVADARLSRVTVGRAKQILAEI
jgi:hypothetical protein